MPPGVNFVTGLPFGSGHIGEKTRFASDAEKEQFAVSLESCTVPLTIWNTADCVDERETIALGDGTTDRAVLENRVVAQLAGGLGLAVTKAAVGANLAVIRDATDFKAAYLTMYELLVRLGYEDGGHAKCGASALVETSVSDEVSTENLLMALPVLTTVDIGTPELIEKNKQTKRQLLESGFFGNWNPGWHEDFLSQKTPHNFSILRNDPTDPVTHGHHSSGVLAIEKEGYGFAKNRFIHTTGLEAFATTVAAAEVLTNSIIRQIGGSQEERSRLRLEFGVDAPQVLNQLVVTGHPVFKLAA